MNLKNFFLIGLSAALLLLSSCKEKDDSSTKPSLNGSLTFSIPTYVELGSSFTLTPSGVKKPSSGMPGYYWSSSWDSAKDTTKTEDGSGDGSWSVKVPDEIGTYNITCVAFSADYSASSFTRTIYVIDPALNKTITGTGISEKDDSFVDPRDNSVYYTMTCGGKTWMKNNLYYKDSGISLDECPVMDAVAGRFYTFDEARTACLDGWHLASEEEFTALANSVGSSELKEFETLAGAAGDLMADASFLGTKMWEFWPAVKITNKSGFSAIPLGYCTDQNFHKFEGMNSYAVFWTSHQTDEAGWYRYIYVDKNNVMGAYGDKNTFRANVRCVKD